MKLTERETRYRNVRVIHEGIDAAIIATEGWRNPTLGQSQNVQEWISDPKRVDWRIRKNLSRFASLLTPSAATPRVIDVGCYGGYAFDWLERKIPGVRYLGVDIEPGFVEAAARAHAGKAASFSVGNALDLNQHFLDRHGTFDAALCLRLVIHLPFLDRIFEGLMRAAPLALVGLRLAPKDCAVERIDDVSGQRHFYRWFSLATVERAIPLGCEWKIYRDGSYDSLVIRRKA